MIDSTTTTTTSSMRAQAAARRHSNPSRPTRAGAYTGFGTSANSPSNARHDGRPVSDFRPSTCEAQRRDTGIKKQNDATPDDAVHAASYPGYLFHPATHYMQRIQLVTVYPPLSNRPTAAFLGICVRLLGRLIHNDRVLSAFALEQSPAAPLAPLKSPVAPTGQSVKSGHPQMHAHSGPHSLLPAG
ncbi:hypothetical protein CH063_00552, partial [Colletotrichum higginsianum]